MIRYKSWLLYKLSPLALVFLVILQISLNWKKTKSWSFNVSIICQLLLCCDYNCSQNTKKYALN